MVNEAAAKVGVLPTCAEMFWNTRAAEVTGEAVCK